MSALSKLFYNKHSLQIILDVAQNLRSSGVIVESSFVPTSSGSDNLSRLQDINVDLQRILNTINNVLSKPNARAILRDFKYIDNGNYSYTLTDWLGTCNGVPSTELIIPDTDEITIIL